MARTTREEKDFLSPGFSAEDLDVTKWFLHIVVTLYPDALHSHANKTAVPDGKGGRKLTSVRALLHEQWPHVPMSNILTTLARLGFITPPTKTAEPATNAESRGYSFRLVPRGGSLKPRARQQDRGGGVPNCIPNVGAETAHNPAVLLLPETLHAFSEETLLAKREERGEPPGRCPCSSPEAAPREWPGRHCNNPRFFCVLWQQEH
jgi:hypothetical protein